MNFITKFILDRIKADVANVEPFTGIVFKDCKNCQSCVHVFKTMQEDPCWDCIEHNYDAYAKR